MKIWENRNIEDLDGEIWKDIEGYPDYRVSNLGRIKSFKQRKEGKILSQYKNSDEYLHVRLYKNRKGENKYIHDLMFESFNNYKLKKCECVHHIDFTKDNNDLDNFQLMTNSEHSKLHNSGENHPRGMLGKKHSEETKQLIKENHADVSGKNNPFYGKNHSEKTKQSIRKNHPGVKLKEQDIIQIRESDLPQKEIAEMFGVHQTTISKIKTGRRWKHI